MARKSRTQPDAHIDRRTTLWKAALYIRLSREDGDKDESDSVINQRNMLVDFVHDESGMDVYDIYVDDGWSGTNFERPSFKKMMNDIKERKVNCVIVKDLSRFGRNYIDSGNYIEKVFPFLDVRFISINDFIDSVKNPQSTNTVLLPFKNLINDEYCRDISNKVRSSLDMKRKNGKHIGSFACYGYKKDPNDHNKLVIDEYAASIVRDIFKWFLQGMGKITIAKRLNEQGVPNPTEYKRKAGLNYRHPSHGKGDGLWPDSSVRRILTNRMLTGTLVQGVNKVKSYKVQVCVAQPQNRWIEVENAHEAIIDVETFEKVQAMMRRDTRTAPNANQLYLFSGFLKCHDCGKSMNRRTNKHSYGTYVYYACSTFKKAGACSKHSIRHERLEEAVLATIRHQIQLAAAMDEVVRAINQKAKISNDKGRLVAALAEKEAEKANVEKMKLSLYPDWKNGDITKEEYAALKERFDVQLQNIEESMEKLKRELDEYDQGVDGENAFLKHFTKQKELKVLSREILAELVDVIEIHEGGGITIKFKFLDEFQRAMEFIEQNDRQLSEALA